jgi:predicted DNA binding protein
VTVLEAIFKTDAREEWRKELIQKYSATISVIDCREMEEGGCRNLVEIGIPPEQEENVRRDMEVNPTVGSMDLDTVEPGILKGIVTTSVCLGCCRMVGSETFLVEVRMDKDGCIIQRIISRDRETVRQAMGKLEALGHEVTLVKLTTLEQEMFMTGYQEDVLMIAYERGYFESPRRTDLKTLSKMFGISIATMSEILRKAQRKVMAEHFKEND